MNEQRGNVYENKGSVFRTPLGSWNVIENKSVYALKAGMLLKTKDVVGMSYVVGGGKSRIQEPGSRSQNEEHQLSADCLLLTADCLLPR